MWSRETVALYKVLTWRHPEAIVLATVLIVGVIPAHFIATRNLADD